MRVGLIAASSLALGVALATPPAHARTSHKDLVAAKKAEREAKKHEQKKEWSDARDALKHAIELHDTASLHLELAKVEQKLGHLTAALAELKSVADDKHASWHQKRSAKAELKGLESRIPTLTVTLTGASDAMVTVDDVPVQPGTATRVDPGERHVHAEAAGQKPFDDSVTVKEGDTRSVEVRFETAVKLAAAAPVHDAGTTSTSSTGRTLGYVSLVVGGAGVVVGSVFALQSRTTKQDLDAMCGGSACPASQRDLYDKGKQQADIATAGFIVGGVGLALGAVLLLASPSPEKEKQARIVPLIGPGSVGVRGKF